MSPISTDLRESAPRLQPNRVRIVEAILFLIEEAARRGTYVTQYDIVKSLFIADTKHLNTHGRPVTFDNYVAMENGPVASEAYDMLKPKYDWKGAAGVADSPWHRRPSPVDGPNSYRYTANRSANLRKISKTDVQALEEGLTLVKELKFKGTKDFTHRHKAYEAAWRDNGGKAFDMNYNLLLDEHDPELIDELVDASRHS